MIYTRLFQKLYKMEMCMPVKYYKRPKRKNITSKSFRIFYKKYKKHAQVNVMEEEKLQ